MRDEALASGKNWSTPIPNIPLRFEIMVTAQLQRGNAARCNFADRILGFVLAITVGIGVAERV